MNNSIGLFDSGVGGLSVLREIYNQLPCENILYFADHMHIPYSIKPEKLIKKYVFEIINFLIKEKAKITQRIQKWLQFFDKILLKRLY